MNELQFICSTCPKAKDSTCPYGYGADGRATSCSEYHPQKQAQAVQAPIEPFDSDAHDDEE